MVTAALVNEWRRSCNLTSSNPASFRIRRQGFSRLTKHCPCFALIRTYGLSDS
jgi:hypothetical protein